MDETIIFPSPNWFKTSVLAVSNDNWLIYGGPSKSLCVLEPLPADPGLVVQGNQGYQAHVVNWAHPEKVVCVDISPEWPEKKYVVSGSADGTVKQWNIEPVQNVMKIKATHSHEVHFHDKEDVIGVGYCQNGYAVTVGGYGQIVKWDLNSNVAKTYKNILKNFRPMCIACSPHIHLNVAIGTKQGVVFVLDLTGAGRVVYKVRGQDDEICKVVWCPQYEVTVKKTLKDSGGQQTKSLVTKKMEKIRNEPVPDEILKELDERVKKSALVEHYLKTAEKDNIQTSKEDSVSVKSDEVAEQQAEAKEASQTKAKEGLDESGIEKTLPDDSFDNSIVVEDDMFDIYKDHEADEFGHKKYQPEDILVKVTEESKEDDYLEECSKLKDEILKRKDQAETSLNALVEALDKTHMEASQSNTLDKAPVEANQSDSLDKNNIDESLPDKLNNIHTEASQSQESDKIDANQNQVTTQSETHEEADKNIPIEASDHIHKHLLATVSIQGNVRVWSKTGKMVGSTTVHGAGGGNKKQKNQRHIQYTSLTTLYWYTPEMLLIGDGKSQMLECNPLQVDCKNKLEWKVLHTQHRRGLFCITSNAPRVQLPETEVDNDQWTIWSIAQDRSLIQYSMKKRQAIAVYTTCGGFIYMVEPCPYDAGKLAISVGDGAVRVWQTSTLEENEKKLSFGHMTTYWQNVQGKVLTVAWHPTRENCLAFATAESRVGLIDTSSKHEKPAKVLLPALSGGGVYTLCWGEGNDLYACGGGEIVKYQTDRPEDAPLPLRVELEGKKWDLSTLMWYPHAILCGSHAGGVAVLSPSLPFQIIAASFAFSKMIHSAVWHPQETSTSSDASPLKNLIAVSSIEKACSIIILEYGDKEDGSKQLTTWKTLLGHKNTVLQLVWNPHVDGQLLSTSQDATVRLWDVAEGVCKSIFGGHTQSALTASWCAFPQLANKVISGGGDGCLRIWDVNEHQAENYDGAIHYEVGIKKKKNRKEKDGKQAAEEEPTVTEDQQAALLETKVKSSKKFLLPMTYRQTIPCKINAVKKMLKKHLEGSGDGVGIDSVAEASQDYDTDYIKMFGSINEINELLDTEMERHEDTGHLEAWMMLSIFRGHIDSMIQRACQRDMLDPYLVSIAPCVSFKYWKDVSQLYLTQIDRLVAKGEESKLYETKTYGGPVYRKAATLLSLHDVKGAVAVLTEARLFKEAYILCRTRYIDSIAEQTLHMWAHRCLLEGTWNMAAICYIALGNLSEAAAVLAKSKDEDSLSLAADLAKIVGQTTFADHVEKKIDLIKNSKTEEAEELEPLPSRADLEQGQGDVILEKAEKQTLGTEALLQELHEKMELLMKNEAHNLKPQDIDPDNTEKEIEKGEAKTIDQDSLNVKTEANKEQVNGEQKNGTTVDDNSAIETNE